MVAVLSGAVFVPPARWLHLLRARAQRLLVPFFALGILVVFGKALLTMTAGRAWWLSGW
jgi:hypothetical protein